VQHAAFDELLFVLPAIQLAARNRRLNVCRNPAGVESLRDFDECFGDDISLEPFTESQPEIHILARRQALVEALDCVQSGPPNHAEGCFPDDVVYQQRPREIGSAVRDVPTATPIWKYTLSSSVDEPQSFA
jgi:hypothetical protein